MMLFKDSDLMKIKDASVREALMVVMESNDSFHYCYIDRNNGLCLKFWGILTLDQIKDVIIHFKNDVCVNDITPMEFIDYDHRYDEDKPFTYVYI